MDEWLILDPWFWFAVIVGVCVGSFLQGFVVGLWKGWKRNG